MDSNNMEFDDLDLGIVEDGLDDLGELDTDTFDELESDIQDDTDDTAVGENYDSSQIMSSAYDFINMNGDIVVQNKNVANEDSFELIYVPIDNIAITNRIRKQDSAEALVRSVKSTGLIQPITVAPTATSGLYVLLDGFRRIQACARAGIKDIPCIVNHCVSTQEIPVIEAMYNHNKHYNTREMVDYIEYLEKQKGIMNPAMIEYLLQLNSGDYSKLMDVLTDNDDDIVSKLFEGIYDIGTAYKKLEQRRRKESVDEKEMRKADAVYSDEEASGADQIQGSGESANENVVLTPEQIAALAINADNLDDDIDDTSLEEMVEEGKQMPGFQPHKQKTGDREYVDPIIKKTVMVRDNSTCQCCKRGGTQMVDILDYHHVLPVFLGGADTPENGIMLCVACHRLVHLYSTDDMHVDPILFKEYDELTDEEKSKQEVYKSKELFEDEKKRFKRIIKLGDVIRKGMVAKGINKSKMKKEHSNTGIGRRKPGVNAEQEGD